MIIEWNVYSPVPNPETCIISLAGRGSTCEYMAKIGRELALHKTLVVAMRPVNYQWYPQPISSIDQDEAVAGLPDARKQIDVAVRRITAGWGIKKDKIALIGYSAGGVMALEAVMHAKQSYAAAVCFCGAILEPDNIPECKHPDTNILLVHNQDDSCFDWEERYLPMKEALSDKNYSVDFYEWEYGGHQIGIPDILRASRFLGPTLGYGEDWMHPREAEIIKRQQEEAENEEPCES